MITAELGILMGLPSLVLMGAAIFYNLMYRRYNHGLVISSATILIACLVGQAFLFWLHNLSPSIQVSALYFFRATAYLVLFLMLFIVNCVISNTVEIWARDIRVLLLICAVSNILLYVDRNVLPLDKFDGEPNIYNNGYWVLWDVYSAIIITADLAISCILLFAPQWNRLRSNH